jgi:hypothetical protein
MSIHKRLLDQQASKTVSDQQQWFLWIQSSLDSDYLKELVRFLDEAAFVLAVYYGGVVGADPNSSIRGMFRQRVLQPRMPLFLPRISCVCR